MNFPMASVKFLTSSMLPAMACSKFQIQNHLIMKKFLFIFILIGGSAFKCHATDKDPVNLGLVSQLVEIKYITEAYLSKIVADSDKSSAQKDSALIRYNDVRIQVDRIIFQLTADMVANNSVKIYRRLNGYYAKHRLSETEGAGGAVLMYAMAFRDLHGSYQTNIFPGKPGLRAELISASTILSVASTGWTILKGIREQRGKKVDGIVELLNNLRLNPPAELLKGKK